MTTLTQAPWPWVDSSNQKLTAYLKLNRRIQNPIWAGIFVTVFSDPVGTRLVASLARPGGNLTGLSLLAPELSGKRLELLKEAVPGIARVAVLWNPTALGSSLKAMEAAAPFLGVQIQPLEVRSSTDFEGALQAAAKGRAGALAVTPDPLFNSIVIKKGL